MPAERRASRYGRADAAWTSVTKASEEPTSRCRIHLLVDTLGLPLSISVTPASAHDKVGAWRLLAGLAPLVPRLTKIWADGAYTSKKLARWCAGHGGWELEIVGRDPEAQGFAVQPRRWVVERSFAWLVRNRRLRIDYERRLQTSEALVEIAFIRMLTRRLARHT